MIDQTLAETIRQYIKKDMNEEERSLTTKEQILDELAYALGGRAAEELVFGKISTGALNDLEKVTKQAYAMVSYFGMSSEVGNMSFYDSSGQNEYGFTKPYSEKTAELIDAEAKRIVADAYERAKVVIKKNRDGLEKLADLLLEREVIFSEDLEKVFGKRAGDAAEKKEAAKPKAVKSVKAATKSKTGTAARKKAPGKSAEEK